ncbi:TerC family protein [bacterium]|nr:TerC family protein [bacterium]
MGDVNMIFWVAFHIFIIAMLALDLGVFHRNSHVVSMKEALTWSAVWVALALVFNGWVYFEFGKQAGVEFFTGYLVEKSLSVDNIFVFTMIFAALNIPRIYQHRVLFWGVLTALVLRAVMILAGVKLIETFHWSIYVFGALLVVTALKMLKDTETKELHLENSLPLRLLRKVMPVTHKLDGENFTTRVDGRWFATPLLAALILVEASDVVFAVDSIPAVLAISKEPFIVYTSNVFAIMGLRSLYFVLADLAGRFAHLKYGLAAVLFFVGSKMIAVDLIKIPPFISLAIISSLLGLSILSSLLHSSRQRKNPVLK